MKRIAFALFFLTLLLYNGAARADATASIVIEASTGRVLHEKNADMQLPMASTTKIMTALLALENCNLDEVVTAGEHAFGVPGTSIYLEQGESLTIEQMLYGLMLASGNDAAVAIAEHIAGSVEAFCDLMNARAYELGCVNTHFVTPHGLPAANHYTTARDLATISRAAMKNEVFRLIVSTQRVTIPWTSRGYDRVLNNKNRLLATYNGALGIKTGYTKAAGRCLSFAAERDGMTLIGIVLNCPEWFEVSAALLDSVFEHYEMKRVFREGEVIADIQVTDGVENSVRAIASSDVAAPALKGEEPSVMISLPQTLPAGFSKGEIVGLVEMKLGEETLISVPVITASGVEKSTFLGNVREQFENWLLVSD